MPEFQAEKPECRRAQWAGRGWRGPCGLGSGGLRGWGWQGQAKLSRTLPEIWDRCCGKRLSWAGQR